MTSSSCPIQVAVRCVKRSKLVPDIASIVEQLKHQRKQTTAVRMSSANGTIKCNKSNQSLALIDADASKRNENEAKHFAFGKSFILIFFFLNFFKFYFQNNRFPFRRC